MILIFIFLLIAFCIIAMLFSGKSLSHIWAEIKYEFVYNILGAKALIDDIINKSRNKTDLPTKIGQIALVSGGARGIGTEIVKMLMQCDMHVIIGCRNVSAGEALKEKIRKQGVTSGDLTCFQLDVGSIESVKSFSNTVSNAFPKIHILVNNAGIMFGPYVETVDGFESQFAVNYLGHFLLTHLLLPRLVAAGSGSDTKARVVNVSSCAHLLGSIHFDDINMRKQFITAAAYAQSKLAQVLFTKYLDAQCKTKDIPVQVYAVHPGIVNTDLFNGTPLKMICPWMPGLLFKTAAEGAVSVVHTCVAAELEEQGGSYISNCRVTDVHRQAHSVQLQEKLYEFSKSLLEMDEKSFL